MGRLTGKVAIVSGASRGMGASHARAIVAEGGQVVLGVRDETDPRVVTLVAELGDDARTSVLDVRSEANWQGAVETALASFGALNVLVNNAGIVTMGSVDDYDLETWNDMLAVNLTGAFLGIKACVPAMREHGPASIINISSAQGFAGISELHGYTAAKYGLRGLTRSVALELAGSRIRCNCICPGTVATDMNEGLDVTGFNAMNRKGDTSEVSSLVVHLASDESTFMTGADLVVDGGELAGHAPALQSV
ncbi:SDR family oxidoreductase [Aeromicrobium sp.]|uniref:SDR family oxidoreductase n=1 Tax=Aeromicrobium sp. TaxID=1871063 RepID=UPI0025C09E9E|nr:SDR family oxidoreductase [Aeromicrobium sp.]MCK5892624.1 SDR family oxidoreductase [Aeromicrobium sp.]